MNRIKAWVRAFFGLSRRETTAFLVLLPLLAVGVFVIPVYRSWQLDPNPDFTKENQTLDSLLALLQKPENSNRPDSFAIELKSLDPNLASVLELTNLGMPEYLATRIDNYRNKGGKFYVKSDLLKIYGFDSLLYITLQPYINLPETKVVAKSVERTIAHTKPEIKPKVSFDLNLADTTQLISVYGIGSKLATRIVKYRNSLGGFLNYQQVKEVYGLDSIALVNLEKVSFIDPAFSPKLIPINTATEKELSAHPYIKYNLAKAITTYRFQHGNFQSVEELRKIALVDESFYTRIKPYLTLNDVTQTH